MIEIVAALMLLAAAPAEPPTCPVGIVQPEMTETEIRDAALEAGCYEVDPVAGYVKVCWDLGMGRTCSCWRVIYPGGVRVMIRVPCKS